MRNGGLGDYGDWLVTAPRVACCVLERRIPLLLGSAALAGLLQRAASAGGLDGLIGRPAGPWNERQARLSVGLDAASGDNLLWAMTPVETDLPERRLQVGLLLGRDRGEIGSRLAGALEDATFRHSTTQPLTALSFLLENLYFAFLEAVPAPAYLERKRGDLEAQMDRLGELMVAGSVLADPGT